VSVLFDRSYKLIIDDISIEGGGIGKDRIGLDIAFKIESSSKAEPNKAEIQIWNLNPDHRSDLQKRFGAQIQKGGHKSVPVELHAGYKDDRGVIFRGDLRNLITERDGDDFVTKVSGTDGGVSYNRAHVSRSFAPGTRVYDVASHIAGAMGVGLGNLSDFSSSISIHNLGTTYPEGISISGPAERAMSTLMRSCRLSWSVQKGVLQICNLGKPIDREVYRLSSDTGMIGIPVPEVDAIATAAPAAGGKESKAGLLKVRTLLLHQLYPKAIVQLDSADFKGGYQITQVDHAGDSAQVDWYTDVLLRPY
jgi:hypothetical protein